MSEESTTPESHEESFVIIKPDGLHRGLAGEIVSQFESAWLRVVAVDVRTPDEETARENYGSEIAERHGETVRENLVEYITEFSVTPMVVKGGNAVEKVRQIVGDKFNPMECPAGTVRSDYSNYSASFADAEDIPVPNLAHAAEDTKDAKREIELWFPEGDFLRCLS